MIESLIRAIIKLAQAHYTLDEIIKITTLIYEKTEEEIKETFKKIEREGIFFIKENKIILLD
jgi:hypothetical protein